MQEKELNQIRDDIAARGEAVAILIMDDDSEICCRISLVLEIDGFETLFVKVADGSGFRVSADEVDRVIFYLPGVCSALGV